MSIGTTNANGKLGTATKGSSTLPIYMNAGVPTAITRDNTATVTVNVVILS